MLQRPLNSLDHRRDSRWQGLVGRIHELDSAVRDAAALTAVNQTNAIAAACSAAIDSRAAVVSSGESLLEQGGDLVVLLRRCALHQVRRGGKLRLYMSENERIDQDTE